MNKESPVKIVTEDLQWFIKQITLMHIWNYSNTKLKNYFEATLSRHDFQNLFQVGHI